MTKMYVQLQQCFGSLRSERRLKMIYENHKNARNESRVPNHVSLLADTYKTSYVCVEIIISPFIFIVKRI